ncbi:trans-sialidase [Trypanosoma cruzi cruzi]|uniref:Putative trans-sialidase, Group V n=1 Tax=Trypanosoma cruzi TaxID=5693 RepID=A0A2V2VRG8_TRYCR|nr:trans-sialidase [Trypanosoma cruzi cruzi]PWU98744.1 putative trans-sialidase, Group V [Trypanosoma cruzi]
MLSRVAAVKAPRTHNRCRVTGSSGRRREGRESEPQRPNMSRRVFTSAVLLLVVVCCGSAVASASELPKRKLFVWRDMSDKETVVSLRVPSLVEMNGEVFAVAEAQCTGKKDAGEGGFTGIASKLLTLTDEQPRKELDKNKLKTQVLEECPSEKNNCASQEAAQAGSRSVSGVRVSRPTTVVKGTDIYMLAGIYVREGTAGSGKSRTDEVGLLLARGNISGDGDGKRILWGDTFGIPKALFEKQHESLTQLISGGGSGVKMEDDTLVFPVEGKKEKGESNEGKTFSLLIYTSKDSSWKLSKDVSVDGCSDPSVVEWEKDKLIMMTACDDGRRRVYESGDKGDSWTEALGTLSRVWGNKKGEVAKGVGSGFITATVGDDRKKVMLVTLPMYSKEKGNEEKGELRLWVTDNTHIVDIGPVSEKEDDVAASSLLYKSGGNGNNKEELIALYEKRGNGESSYGMVSVRLTEQLQRVKEVLKTWKEVDERVSQLCATLLAEEDRLTGTACTTDVKITDGLVGFLSGNFSENTWRDEYLGVNATVNKNDDRATKNSDGVTFQGAWAEWPVGRQGENQLYHFANYNFTLLATVSIDDEPTKEGNIPVMGVRLNDEKKTKLIELSYDNGKKWQLLSGDETKSKDLSVFLGLKTKDHVIILLWNGNQCSAYVDGQLVGENEKSELKNTNSKEISHFYIGGDGDNAESRGDVSVTVKNVLLYNRPLNEAEITALNPNKASILPQEENPSEHSTVSSTSIIPPIPPATPNAQKTGTPSKPGGTQLTEQGQSMGSSGAGTGGASASAVSTVSTPSAEEESVMQVTSGTSPDGTQTVGGGSTAVGEPTMENREGGTDGQEEEVQPQEREVNATALNSSLGNVSQGNNSDAGTMRGSGLLPSLLLLLLGLWGFAAL